MLNMNNNNTRHPVSAKTVEHKTIFIIAMDARRRQGGNEKLSVFFRRNEKFIEIENENASSSVGFW